MEDLSRKNAIDSNVLLVLNTRSVYQNGASTTESSAAVGDIEVQNRSTFSDVVPPAERLRQSEGRRFRVGKPNSQP